MMRKLITGIVTAIVLSVTTFTVLAQDDGEVASKVEQRLAEFRDRLDLTDEQVAEMRPVLEQSAQHSIAVMKKYGMITEDGQRAKRPDREDMQAMRDEMRSNSENMNSQLAKILNPDQMKELQVLRKENQEEMRRRVRERRDSN